MEPEYYKMLPDELNLEMVAVKLGLTDLSGASQLETILHHQREGRIALKSKSMRHMHVQKAEFGLCEEYHNDDHLILLANGDGEWIDTGGRAITLGPAYVGPAGLLSTMTLVFEGQEYYLLDEPGMHPETIRVDVNSVYVERESLTNFLQVGAVRAPPYADPSSEHFAPELDLAMKLHQALRVEGWGNANMSLDDRLHLWIQENLRVGTLTPLHYKRLKAVIGDGKKIYGNPKNIYKT